MGLLVPEGQLGMRELLATQEELSGERQEIRATQDMQERREQLEPQV